MGDCKADIYCSLNEEHVSQYQCLPAFYWSVGFKADLIRFMCCSVIMVWGLCSFVPETIKLKQQSECFSLISLLQKVAEGLQSQEDYICVSEVENN